MFRREETPFVQRRTPVIMETRAKQEKTNPGEKRERIQKLSKRETKKREDTKVLVKERN